VPCWKRSGPGRPGRSTRLRGGVPGRDRRQGPRQPGRAEQARLHRDRDRHRRGEARPGHLGRQDPAAGCDRQRGRPLLGTGYDGPTQPRGPRHPRRLRRRTEGFRGRDHPAFPGTIVQRRVVHFIRNSLRPVARRDAAVGAAELRKIYTAPTAEAAFDALAAFAESPWRKKYPRPSGPGRTPGMPSSRSRPSCRPYGSCSTPPAASTP
jgi:hypothetical protein